MIRTEYWLRRGARDLSEQEVEFVSGGIRTATLCTASATHGAFFFFFFFFFFLTGRGSRAGMRRPQDGDQMQRDCGRQNRWRYFPQECGSPTYKPSGETSF